MVVLAKPVSQAKGFVVSAALDFLAIDVKVLKGFLHFAKHRAKPLLGNCTPDLVTFYLCRV